MVLASSAKHTNKFQLECSTINHWTILARELLRTNYTGIIGLHLNVNCRYGVPKSNYRYQYNQYNQRQWNVYMWKLCTLSSIIKPPQFALAFWFYSLPPSLIHKSCYAQWTFSSNGSCNSLKRWIWLLKLNKSFNKKIWFSVKVVLCVISVASVSSIVLFWAVTGVQFFTKDPQQ